MSARTVVSFHAHPDDEALLTGGTLARAAAEGHRVVLVTATAGEAGLASAGSPSSTLARRRSAELAASAAALGIARVVELGHPDSGFGTPLTPGCFAALSPDGPARELAAILREEHADVLTSYDAAGGYGHPDHVQVHRVGALAARLARTPVVLEATLPREPVARAVGVLRALSRVVPMPQLPEVGAAFTPRSAITCRLDVRAHLDRKLAALRAHQSQSEGGPRIVTLLLRLPAPLRARVLGTEWFRDASETSYDLCLGDLFGSQVDARSVRRS